MRFWDVLLVLVGTLTVLLAMPYHNEFIGDRDRRDLAQLERLLSQVVQMNRAFDGQAIRPG